MELEDLPEATLADRFGSPISGTCVTFEPASAATDEDAVVISMSFVIVSMTIHCIRSEFETLAEALNKGVIGQGKNARLRRLIWLTRTIISSRTNLRSLHHNTPVKNYILFVGQRKILKSTS